MAYPVQKATREETFKCLTDDFSLGPKVYDLLIKSQLQSLDEFRFHFVDEKEIATFLAPADLGDEARISETRMRRAWHAVRQGGALREADRSRVDTADLDELLDEAALRDVKTDFWRRYKLRHPAEITPSDSLVSRCHREMSRRLLMVYNVWTSRSLKHQVTTSQKRRRLADSLFIMDAEEVTHPAKETETYLDLLYTYLLALAFAGSQKAPSCPSTTESLGEDSTKYVLVPLDVLNAYHWRARRASHNVPYASRLAWLEQLDTEERSIWVSEFRDSSLTLGAVIQQTMQKRDAHWAFTSAPSRGPQQPRAPPRPNKSRGGGGARTNGKIPKEQAESTNRGHPRVPKPGSVATKFYNGQKLCPKFQQGQCTPGPKCSLGLHRCGKITPKGRVCGGHSHGANECRR